MGTRGSRCRRWGRRLAGVLLAVAADRVFVAQPSNAFGNLKMKVELWSLVNFSEALFMTETVRVKCDLLAEEKVSLRIKLICWLNTRKKVNTLSLVNITSKDVLLLFHVF